MKWIASIVLCVSTLSLFAQNNDDESEYDENFEFKESHTFDINVGIGFGFDYGGVGGKLTFHPQKNIGLFGAIGYNFNGAGYNGGLIFRFLPDKKVSPYVTAMYGYNAVIVVDGNDDESETYYGVSFGGGIQLHRKDKPNFWNFGLLIPIRSQAYEDAVEKITNNPNYEYTEPLPVSISVGYHFGL